MPTPLLPLEEIERRFDAIRKCGGSVFRVAVTMVRRTYTERITPGYQVRLDAANLAAQCVAGQVANGSVASRVASLTLFFELYLAFGMDRANADMKLLSPRKTKSPRLKVIAGRAFERDGMP